MSGLDSIIRILIDFRYLFKSLDMLSDQEIRGYERYILSDQNLEEALPMLPQNSESTYYLKVMHYLTLGNIDLIDQDKDLVAALDYLKKSSSDRASTVKLREALLRLDAAKNEGERLN